MQEQEISVESGIKQLEKFLDKLVEDKRLNVLENNVYVLLRENGKSPNLFNGRGLFSLIFPDNLNYEKKNGAHPQEPSLDINIAGGAMGQIQILHGSLSEYLIFFGTPIGTEGHSGRYIADIWDWTMEGETWCYLEGETERRVYKPGDEMYLRKGKAKGYCVKDHAWMLEYGRGCIPMMMPFGALASNMFNTLDCATVERTFRDFSGCVIRELLKGKIQAIPLVESYGSLAVRYVSAMPRP